MGLSRLGRLGIPAALIVSLSALALAQQPTFRAGTQVVSLFATVTDTQSGLSRT